MPNGVGGLGKWPESVASAPADSQAAGLVGSVSERAGAMATPIQPLIIWPKQSFAEVLRAMAEGRMPTVPVVARGYVAGNVSWGVRETRDGTKLTVPPGSDLSDTRFSDWLLVDAAFAGVNLDNAEFRCADLSGASLCRRDESGSSAHASILGTDFESATLSLDTNLHGMPFWQARKFNVINLLAWSLERIRTAFGDEIADELAGSSSVHPAGSNTELSISYDTFMRLMPSIMGIEALPTLSDTHQDAYRADTAHDIKALCYAMSGEQIPHRTIDASGTNLRDTEFSVAPNTRFIFDNADMRDATVLNITADGMTMRGNNTLIDNGYLSVWRWVSKKAEFDTIRVHLDEPPREESMFGCVRQYVPDAKPGDTVMLTRAQFGVFAKEWYGIEGIA